MKTSLLALFACLFFLVFYIKMVGRFADLESDKIALKAAYEEISQRDYAKGNVPYDISFY